MNKERKLKKAVSPEDTKENRSMASLVATWEREEQEIINEISNHENQLQTALNDGQRKELQSALEIARVKLEITGYTIEYENATTKQQKSRLRDTINKARDTLNLLLQKQTSGHFVSKLFVFIVLGTINILIVHYLSGKFYLVIIAFILSSIGYFQQIIIELFAGFARESWTRVRISPSLPLPQQLGGTIAHLATQVDDSKEVVQNLIGNITL